MKDIIKNIFKNSIILFNIIIILTTGVIEICYSLKNFLNLQITLEKIITIYKIICVASIISPIFLLFIAWLGDIFDRY